MPLKPPSDPFSIAVWATTVAIVLKSGLRITPADMISCGDGSVWFQHKLTDEERAELAARGVTRCISPGVIPASADASPRLVRTQPFGRRASDARPPLHLELLKNQKEA